MIGAIIFIVLIIVQFMVINKGSERVAEVSARFTLDAMPGKQMAIDADLNTGAITEKEARERRQKLQDESSFFGSMDGATKYVKGDATAGLFDHFINLIGGTLMGVMRSGMDFTSAIQQYGLLTIGDGLCSQIPSLLISLATGILVTKGIQRSRFQRRFDQTVIWYSKGTLYCWCIYDLFGSGNTAEPGLVRCLWCSIFFSGYSISKSIGEESIEEEVAAEESEAEEIRRPENVVSLCRWIRLNWNLAMESYRLRMSIRADLLDRVVMIRRQIALELGTVVPIIRLRDNIQLNPNQYIIKIKGIQVAEGEILLTTIWR